MNCAFRSVVNCPKNVRYYAGYRADIDDEALRLDKQWYEGLCYGDDGKEIGFEGAACFFEWALDRGNSAVLATVVECQSVSCCG